MKQFPDVWFYPVEVYNAIKMPCRGVRWWKLVKYGLVERKIANKIKAGRYYQYKYKPTKRGEEDN